MNISQNLNFVKQKRIIAKTLSNFNNFSNKRLLFFIILHKIRSMIKIWGKVLTNERIVKHKTIEVDGHTTTFFDMLKDLCQSLNIPTPVLLDKHVHDFNIFNMCVFKPDDFVEVVNFDRFVLEHLAK